MAVTFTHAYHDRCRKNYLPPKTKNIYIIPWECPRTLVVISYASALYVQNDSGHEAQDIEQAIEAWKVSRVKLKKQTEALFKSLEELGYQ